MPHHTAGDKLGEGRRGGEPHAEVEAERPAGQAGRGRRPQGPRGEGRDQGHHLLLLHVQHGVVRGARDSPLLGAAQDGRLHRHVGRWYRCVLIFFFFSYSIRAGRYDVRIFM